MRHKVDKLILDIKIAIDEIQQFCAGKSFENFDQDRLETRFSIYQILIN